MEGEEQVKWELFVMVNGRWEHHAMYDKKSELDATLQFFKGCYTVDEKRLRVQQWNPGPVQEYRF